MRELFIQESDDKKVKLTGPVTLVVALVFLLIFAGCSPAARPDAGPAWGAVTFALDKSTRYAPSIAIWVQDEETGGTATLYATKKAAGTALDNRPGALPVWSAARHAAGAEKLDAVSSATPSAEASIPLALPDAFKGKKIKLFIEANSSFDYNDFYQEGLKSGEDGYSDVNGQPSVVWTVSVDLAAVPSGTLSPAVEGHGDVLGASGGIDADMSRVTSAASLLQNVKIEYGK
jgi:hypothetical protein